MRVWDLSPGYLNRQSLLGEHRELHGIYSILTNGKQGYSRHPETMRWSEALSGLVLRHRLLAAEMQLRGFLDRTPIDSTPRSVLWPATFVTDPAGQIALLRQKYINKEKGRIPLPHDAQNLWAQHKYSVMARDPKVCRSIGRSVARLHSSGPFAALARDLALFLRDRPGQGGLSNAIEHMWGHVRIYATAEDIAQAKRGPREMLRCVQILAMRERDKYVTRSTALSELSVWFD